MDFETAGPSESTLMTRKEIFGLMRSQNDLNFNDQLEYVENYLISHKSYSEEQIKDIKRNFARMKSEMKHRWVAAKYRSDLFEKTNEKWLNGTFELPLIPTRAGRPAKPFEETSERGKRRKTETIRLSDSPEKIIYAAQMDGNTSRRFFENPELAAEITGLDINFNKKFKVILECISCGYKIDAEKFKKFTTETAALYVTLYGRHNMTPTMHKILMHGATVIEDALLPIGQLSEEAAEARINIFVYTGKTLQENSAD